MTNPVVACTKKINLTLDCTILTFNDPEKEAFENIVEKGNNSGNWHFLLSPHCLLHFLRRF